DLETAIGTSRQRVIFPAETYRGRHLAVDLELIPDVDAVLPAAQSGRPEVHRIGDRHGLPDHRRHRLRGPLVHLAEQEIGKRIELVWRGRGKRGSAAAEREGWRLRLVVVLMKQLHLAAP